MDISDLLQPIELIDNDGRLTEVSKKAIRQQMKVAVLLEHFGLIVAGGRVPSNGSPRLGDIMPIQFMSKDSLVGSQIADLELEVKKEVIGSMQRGMKSLERSLR